MRRDIQRFVLEQFLPRALWLGLIVVLGVVLVSAGLLFDSVLAWGLRLGGLGFSVASLILARHFWSIARRDVLSKRVGGRFARYVKEPAYEDKLGYFSEVEQDVRRAFRVLNPENPPVIFVDDLDRCSPGRVSEVMEAINLVLSSEELTCYFVIGMDAELVAASLDVANEKLAARLEEATRSQGSLGWHYLEKFVQLPFTIPRLADAQGYRYLEHFFRPTAASEPLPPINLVDEAKQRVEELAESPEISPQELIGEATQVVGDLRRQDVEGSVEVAADALIAAAERFTDDDPEIKNHLDHYARYLRLSPRLMKRFANLYRFHRYLQWSRQLEGLPVATSTELAHWLVLVLRWPGVVRWIHWERGPNGGFVGDDSPADRAESLETTATESANFEEWAERLDGGGLSRFADRQLFAFLREGEERGESIVDAVRAGAL